MPGGVASPRRRVVAALAGTIASFAAAWLMTAPAAASAGGLRTSCDRARPAVAYRIGKGRLSPPGRRPLPCLEVVSGRTSESATVAVLHSGAILYAPLIENSYPAPLDDRGPAVIAASHNGGRSWSTIEPGDANHILDVPPWMSVDPQTQRIWFATVLPDLCGAEISWSDDGGRTWSTNPAVGCPAMGSEAVLEGPPPAGGARPVSYPHVVYYCANLSDLSPSNLWCYRSLDGGKIFTFVGGFPDPPPKPGCTTEHPARPGAVGTDGDLYFPVFQCGDLSVAISRDEGASWHWVHVTTGNVEDLYTTSLAVDRAGNLYLAWIAGSGSSQGSQPSAGSPNPTTEAIDGSGEPVLSISRNHGASWSRPQSIGPPAVKNAQTIAITARDAGQIAVSYLANTTSASTLVDGWLSETNDALARHALWWAAPLNNPASPLINTSDPTGFGNRLFFTTDAFASDGEPWAAFHCAFTAACPGERIGVVGRLSLPRPVHSRHHRHRHKHRGGRST